MRRKLISLLAILALAACAGSPQAAMELAAQAQMQLEAGQIEAARISINEAIAERDDIPEIYLLKGRIESADQSFQQAYFAYTEALSLDATNVEALAASAQIALMAGLLEESTRAADRVLILKPGDPNSKLIKGMVLLAQRNPTEAGLYADEILAGAPNDPWATVLKSRVLAFENKDTEALALLLKARDDAKPNEALERTLLEIYRETSDRAGMIETFRRLRAMAPADSKLALDEAQLRYKTGDIAGGQAIIFGLLEKQELPTKGMERVLMLWQAYDPDPAKGRAAENPPRFAADANRRAFIRHYIDMGRPDAALILLAKASSPDDRMLRARALLARGADPAALVQVEEFLERDGTQCDALVARALDNRRKARLREAVNNAQRAVSECPDSVGAYLELARVQQARDDRIAEKYALDRALEQLPQSWTIAKTYFDRAVARDDLLMAVSVGRRVTHAAKSAPYGWNLLLDGCTRMRDKICQNDARTGLTAAQRSFRVDPLPGDKADRGLFGALKRK